MSVAALRRESWAWLSSIRSIIGMREPAKQPSAIPSCRLTQIHRSGDDCLPGIVMPSFVHTQDTGKPEAPMRCLCESEENRAFTMAVDETVCSSPAAAGDEIGSRRRN